MTIPGLIWMPGGRMSPTQLLAGETAIYGSDLLGFWVGESIVFDVNNRIASWPGLGGPTLTKWNADNTYPLRNVRNGRVGVINNQAQSLATALLATFATAPKSMGGVALANEVPIQDSYNILIRGNPQGTTDSTWVVCGAVGTSALYNSYGTKYRDTTATTALDTNLHFYSADNAANTVAGIAVLGYSHIIGGGWQGEAYAFRSLSVVPTAGQLAAEVALFKRYYGYT